MTITKNFVTVKSDVIKERKNSQKLWTMAAEKKEVDLSEKLNSNEFPTRNKLIISGKYNVGKDGKVDQKVVEKEWKKYGFSCDYYLEDKPGKEWSTFIHTTDEIGCIICGKLEFNIDGNIFIVSSGDEMLVPKGTKHSCKNIYKGNTIWILGYN